MWLHTDAPRLDGNKVKILLDRDQALQVESSTPAVDPAALSKRLEDQICEFWRCIALTPAVIGREEHIVSLFGLGIEVNILSDVIINGYEVARDSGVKRLNPFLPATLRTKIEAALALDGLTNSSLVQAHLALARIMQEEGRKLATRHGFAYPVELETAALEYTMRELAMVGVVVRE